MVTLTRQQVKTLIECSTTFEKADSVIEKYCGFKTTKEKIDFVKGMFDVQIIDQQETDPEEYVYRLLLTSSLPINRI